MEQQILMNGQPIDPSTIHWDDWASVGAIEAQRAPTVLQLREDTQALFQDALICVVKYTRNGSHYRLECYVHKAELERILRQQERAREGRVDA